MGNGLSDRKADTQELMQIRQEAYADRKLFQSRTGTGTF